MPWRHVAVPSWCKCGNCCKTAKEDDNVCCGVHPCRSYEFKEYLERLTESDLKANSGGQSVSRCEDFSDKGKLRRSWYEKAAAFFREKEWYPQNVGEEEKYAALPCCVVWTIRRQFKEESGKYTGLFPPKRELLQSVVDARKTFKDHLKLYGAVVDVANPHGGLFTTLRKLESGNQLKGVWCDILRREDGGSVADDFEQHHHSRLLRWTESTNKGVEVLPKLGFLACATAFEAFVHDTVKRCLETVFSTRKVSEHEQERWMSEFEKWLKSRIEESEFWNDKEHKDETRFWTEFLTLDDETTTQKQSQNQTLLNLDGHLSEIVQCLIINPTSQEAVGLVQEMMDTTKRDIMGNLKWTTMDCIQDTFVKLAVEASNNNGKRKRKRKPSGVSKSKKKFAKSTQTECSSPPSVDEESSHDKRKQKSGDKSSGSSSKKQKIEIATPAEGSSLQSPMTDGSSMNNVSDISDWSWCSNTATPSPTAERQMPLITSTPLRVTESGRKLSQTISQTSVSPERQTVCAVEHLVVRYASEYTWEIWLNGASHNVRCRSVKSLSYMSNLFYGMRCIFSHGMPHKTVEFGAMRVDRTPQKLSDLDISVSRKDKTEEECIQTKTLCESYLLSVAKNARENFRQMQMDHDLFLTAQSFYEYAVDIIGSVVACIAYKYGDVKLREKATTAVTEDMEEIQKAVGDAWKLAHEEILTGTSTGLTQDFEDTSLQ